LNSFWQKEPRTYRNAGIPTIRQQFSSSNKRSVKIERFKGINDYPNLVSMPLSLLWNEIISGAIEGHYDQNRRQQYETINFGILYLNTLSRTFKDKFGATIKRKTEGNIVTFDRPELDRLEEVYWQSQEAKINVKIIKDYDEEFFNNVGNEGNVGYEGNKERVYDNEETDQDKQDIEKDVDNNTDTRTLEPTYPTQPTQPTLSLSQNTYSCYKCDKQYLILKEYNSHILNTHEKQPLYPDLSLIKLLGLQPQGNPWETDKK